MFCSIKFLLGSDGDAMEKIKSAIDAVKKHNKIASDGSDKNDDNVRHTNDIGKIEYQYTKVIPLDDQHLTKNRIVAHNKNNQLSIGFDVLRTRIISLMKKNGWRTIGVTSPIPSCGKTLVSINLAISIAHNTDTTAMLVDFDLRRPSVINYMGIDAAPTFNDVLSGDASVQEALINPGIERLVILPTANPVSHSSEVLSSQNVRKIVKDISGKYNERIVIFDLTPLLGNDDALTMLSEVDCVLMVVGDGMVSKEQLKDSLKCIDKEKMLGVVLNKSEIQNNIYY
jgi:Mrp family chromosome partitioning ATPase